MLFGVPNHIGLRSPHRILRTMHASDISCARDRGDVSSRR